MLGYRYPAGKMTHSPDDALDAVKFSG